VPDDLADELEQVIDEMAAITDTSQPIEDAGQEGSASRADDERGGPEQVAEAMRGRLREIQKRSSQ
jgi:hypothetical protein